MASETERFAAEHSIVLWGPPGCGKTTFLCALAVAAAQSSDGLQIAGANPVAAGFLARQTKLLVNDRLFPPATQVSEVHQWVLIEEPPARGFRAFRRSKTQVRKPLTMIDPPGGAYYDAYDTTRPHFDELIKRLTGASGILFFFDPVREYEDGDAFTYLYGVLSELAMSAMGDDGKLPHHIAICVTKFDDIRIMETAARLKMLSVHGDDPQRVPRVLDHEAADLCKALASVSASGNADMVFSAIQQFFHPDRLKFFVTSSIGLYVDPARGVFDPDDYQNIFPEAFMSPRGEPVLRHLKIRGVIRPINVVEPMLWMVRRTTRTRRL